MVNILTLLLCHAVLGLAAWRLLQRDDLDSDPELPGPEVVTDNASGDTATKPVRRSFLRKDKPAGGPRGNA